LPGFPILIILLAVIGQWFFYLKKLKIGPSDANRVQSNLSSISKVDIKNRGGGIYHRILLRKKSKLLFNKNSLAIKNFKGFSEILSALESIGTICFSPYLEMDFTLGFCVSSIQAVGSNDRVNCD